MLIVVNMTSSVAMEYTMLLFNAAYIRRNITLLIVSAHAPFRLAGDKPCHRDATAQMNQTISSVLITFHQYSTDNVTTANNNNHINKRP
jgi:hypothetical protein